MLPKSICFVLAALLVVVPLWILMSYGITADGRPNSPKILIGMTFCFVVGVFWLYEDLKDLLRTRWAAISKADALHRSTCCARAASVNHGKPGELEMLDRSLEAEFESYRKTISTDEARRAFDERIERLLGQHGVDYVRGYVDALKEASLSSALSSQQFEEGRSNARPRNEGCTWMPPNPRPSRRAAAFIGEAMPATAAISPKRVGTRSQLLGITVTWRPYIMAICATFIERQQSALTE
jgi:hypothetical protein